MREITAITSQKRKKDRLNVFLDGEFAFGVNYETAVRFGLKTGLALSDEDVERIEAEEGNSAAYERALSYAVKKVVSEKQMKEYLVRNGFGLKAASIAIAKLKEYGYVDDAEFARAYVATYSRQRGKIRLRSELRQAGVDDEIVERTLEDAEDENSCDSCVLKYLRTHKEVDRQKLRNYLLYRGYDYDTINQTMEKHGL